MFRAKFIREINQILDSSMFSAADFSVVTKMDPLLNIVFLHDNQFNFVVHEEVLEGDTVEYKISNSPGLYWANELRTITDVNKIPKHVQEWVSYVYEDLKCSSPVYDELEELRAKLEEHVQDNVQDPLEKFSPEEFQSVFDKLAELEARIVRMEESSLISESQSVQAQVDIHKIMEGARDLPKGVWYRTAGPKLWKLITKVSSSKEGRMVLTQVAQKALGVDTNAS